MNTQQYDFVSITGEENKLKKIMEENASLHEKLKQLKEENEDLKGEILQLKEEFEPYVTRAYIPKRLRDSES